MHCWARYLLYAIVAVLAIGQMGLSCGQKGPLYLPDEDEPRRAEQTRVPAPEAPGDDLPTPSMPADDEGAAAGG